MKITVDTNVLISALGWKGNEHELIRRVFEGNVKLFMSPELLAEFEEVALRRKFGFSAEEIEGFVGALIEASEIIVPEEEVTSIINDPDDNRVLECALHGKVNFIVSGESHLLKLKAFEGKKIVRASEALKKLG